MKTDMRTDMRTDIRKEKTDKECDESNERDRRVNMVDTALILSIIDCTSSNVVMIAASLDQ